jgi:hypothetical protein
MRNNNDKQTNTTSVLHLEHLDQKKKNRKKKKEMDSTLASLVQVHMKVEQSGTAITRFSAMGWCDICKLMSQIAPARAHERDAERRESTRVVARNTPLSLAYK